ncbi:hypothetical protein CAPTEDRAFT_162279 [Capitella teleta]|uniref:5'-nucleotidase n=1 Tax=Capitella teleta TaxID=283909 RepID=R7U2U9_CAPTE|nr:hypothetical protein CAPTEDRAFT_162279 [Capitella teleta]|eukprot:ELT97986.1 hypothetical protein CAPTEDRAFT_162279 [Capitella teleta]
MVKIEHRSSFLFGVSFLVAATGIWTWRRRSTSCTREIRTMVDALNHPNVHIKDRQHVNKLIQNFIQGGKQKLQVVADFDRTMSRFKSEEGEIIATCHNALDNNDQISDKFRMEATKLRDYYYKIEIDDSLSKEVKYPYMVEWWTKAHDLLVDCGLTRDMISYSVKRSNIVLRDKTSWLLKELHVHDVPLLIFSAGLGDIIEEVIHQQHTMYSNIHIVSNYMDFNNQGTLVGFKGEIIHIYNKNENAIHESDYFEKLQHRENIILMGDSLGDLNMADGASDSADILKIGFLNDKVEERLNVYKDAYDIVLAADETMDIPNAIIRQVLES